MIEVTKYFRFIPTDQRFIEDIQDDRFIAWTNSKVSLVLSELQKYGDSFIIDGDITVKFRLEQRPGNFT